MKLNENSIYFKSLTIENLNCFKGKHEFNFSDKNGKPTQWTVILGNNGTGKTTILRTLADFRPVRINKAIFSAGIINYKGKSDGFKVTTILFPNNEIWYSLGQAATPNEKLIIYGYGARRTASQKPLSSTEKDDETLTLFDKNAELTNSEEWLIQLDYSIKNKSEVAKNRLAKVKEILTSIIFPDITDFKFITDEKLNNYPLFQINSSWIRFEELGYGYQVTIAWLVDLMKKMFERYPESENPLHESAIVLVDEIDLHLHPEWQRKIIKFVGNIFPNTQFIVTTHSPLVVQSAEEINVIVLQKDGDSISVKQSEFNTFKGWSVEEILSELMELGERTKSEDYLKLIKEFDEALDNNNKEQAEKAYQELDKILPPMTHHRKLLKIQMTILTSGND